jgi:nucleoside-diphosphate-sugar epimerase
MSAFARAFSGSCLSLDDHDYSIPRVIARKHVLGSGEDFFDETGRPFQPQPRTLTKVFSGSALDLNAAVDSDSEPASQSVSPASHPRDGAGGQHSFNDFLDHINRNRNGTTQNRTMVLVVGGTGYLAAHVIEQLLKDGYQVRTTVPDMRDNAKFQDLYGMIPELKHMLFVVEGNIFNAASMRNAMANCRYVVHCGVNQLGPGMDVVDSHMQAIRALFDAAREAGGARVERIVLTGSYTNVLSSSKSLAPTSSGLYDESQWNTSANRTGDALSFARVSFEREARHLQELHPCPVELVVMLPAIMIGPSRTTEVSEAMRTIIDFATASPYFPVAPNINWNFVDVRDVAAAHVKAITTPNAAGQRYIVTNSVLSLAELGRHIRGHFPHLTAPVYTAPFLLSLITGPWAHSRATLRYLWHTLGVRRVLDGEKSQRDLGIVLSPIAVTVRDAVQSLIDDGHLPPAPKDSRGESSPKSLLLLTLVVGAGVGSWVLFRRR